MKQKHKQVDYTLYEAGCQLKLPIETEKNIAADNPVRYVKPSDHEQKKNRKHRTDISRRENMTFNVEEDSYTCANGKAITFDYVKKQKSPTGYESEVSVYSCKDCTGCPLKEKCIRG
ncbi:MAG: transposase, partial [Oscillospiraceae bacterium]|nr:transposase [Oscillospiraceae bacterium]